jgi:Cyclin, N-terminal domain
MTAEDALEIIEAMCIQEEQGYQKCDYLADFQFRNPLHHQQDIYTVMDETCRSSMVQWTNKLVDFCQYDRETSDVAISCLDRFLASPEGSQTLLHPQQFQLAAMTALYTAAKVHERQAVEPESIARLSRGVHSKETVEQMELYMLKALQWRVHPPTAIRFAKYFLELIPIDMIDEKRRTIIMDLVRFQLNASLSDYRLSLQRASHLGLAALINAIDDQGLPMFDEVTSSEVQSRIGSLLPAYDDDIIWDIQFALSAAISSQPGTISSSLMPAALSTTSSITAKVLSKHEDRDVSMTGEDRDGSPTVVFLNAA